MEVEGPHPDPQPSNHRKIELQSNLDLTYLQDNLAKSALARLDHNIPRQPSRPEPATVISLDGPSTAAETAGQQQPQAYEGGILEDEIDGDNDPFRRRVRELISEFLAQTWQGAQHSLAINGLDVSDIPVPYTATLSKAPPPASLSHEGKTAPATATAVHQEEKEGVHFTYHPFDPRLQHKVASLHGELEKLTADVSKLRREAPQKAANIYKAALESQMQIDEETYTKSIEQITTAQSEKHNSKGAMKLDTIRKNWSEDVKQNFETGVHELSALAGIPAATHTGTDTGTSQTDSSATTTTITTTTTMTTSKGPSLMETMGKAVRARDVATEMD